jgi:hypothetical protein
MFATPQSMHFDAALPLQSGATLRDSPIFNQII